MSETVGPLIMLRATREKVNLYGVEYRIFRGETQSGIKIEMLGLFQIRKRDDEQKFLREVCAVDVGDPPPTVLLTDHGLVNP